MWRASTVSFVVGLCGVVDILRHVNEGPLSLRADGESTALGDRGEDPGLLRDAVQEEAARVPVGQSAEALPALDSHCEACESRLNKLRKLRHKEMLVEQRLRHVRPQCGLVPRRQWLHRPGVVHIASPESQLADHDKHGNPTSGTSTDGPDQPVRDRAGLEPDQLEALTKEFYGVSPPALQRRAPMHVPRWRCR